MRARLNVLNVFPFELMLVRARVLNAFICAPQFYVEMNWSAFRFTCVLLRNKNVKSLINVKNGVCVLID